MREKPGERGRDRLVRIARWWLSDARLVELAGRGHELDEVLRPLRRLVGPLGLEPREEPGAREHLLDGDAGVE